MKTLEKMAYGMNQSGSQKEPSYQENTLSHWIQVGSRVRINGGGIRPVFKLTEWRKGLPAEGPDEKVSCGWIPYRLATPTIPYGSDFVKFTSEDQRIFFFEPLTKSKKEGILTFTSSETG